MKKIIGGYILRKPNFRRKMRILKLSHSAENVKGGVPSGFLNIQFLANIKTLKGDPLQTLKMFGKKSPSAEKNRNDL